MNPPVFCVELPSYSARALSRLQIVGVDTAAERARFEVLLTTETHPEHYTISTFRGENQTLLGECFLRDLQLGQELKLAKFGYH